MAPKAVHLNGARVKFLFDHMASLVAAAIQFSLPNQPNFTVGSVVLSAPEAVGIFRKTKDHTDHWRAVATALLDAARALDVLDTALRAAIGGAAVGAQLQPQPPQPGQVVIVPDEPEQQQQLVLAVPLRRRAAGARHEAQPPQQPAYDWPIPGMKAAYDDVCKTIKGYLSDAWASTYYLRRAYALLLFLCIRIVPTLLLWAVLGIILMTVFAILADPWSFAKLILTETISHLTKLPKLGRDAIVDLVYQCLAELFGSTVSSLAAPGHCPQHCSYDYAAAEMAAYQHQGYFQNAPFHNASNANASSFYPRVVFMPTNPPPTYPSGTNTLAQWTPAIVCAIVSWACRNLQGAPPPVADPR